MKNFISKALLNTIREDFTKDKSYSVLNEAISQRKRKNYSYETSIFLSHKHDEEKEIRNAIALFNSLGIDVYVDWLDEGMPKQTSGQTAKRIKEKIRENNKFILLATEGAISSKWCNWELGLGDILKYPKNIAVLPITEERNNNWSGTEYLQIYPIITSEYEYTTGTYYVEFEYSRISLVEWLKK